MKRLLVGCVTLSDIIFSCYWSHDYSETSNFISFFLHSMQLEEVILTERYKNI